MGAGTSAGVQLSPFAEPIKNFGSTVQLKHDQEYIDVDVVGVSPHATAAAMYPTDASERFTPSPVLRVDALPRAVGAGHEERLAPLKDLRAAVRVRQSGNA